MGLAFGSMANAIQNDMGAPAAKKDKPADATPKEDKRSALAAVSRDPFTTHWTKDIRLD